MKQKYLILFSLAGLILSLDQWLKHYSRVFLSGKAPPDSVFALAFHQSEGFIFGVFGFIPVGMRDVLFIAIPVFALVLIFFVFLKLRDNQMINSVALCLILSGAIGNLLDRFQFGYVVDVFSIKAGPFFGPHFNLADCSIVIGVILMFHSTFRRGSTTLSP